MINKDNRNGVAFELRKRAEALARKNTILSPEKIKTLSPEEIQQMFHELQVHQIELEMQNEELRRSQAELDAARVRYFDLYDLAPVGYCTVNEKGLILEANLNAATLLDVTRGELIKQPISRYILKEDQDVYYLHRKTLLTNEMPQECDLRIMKNDGTSFWAHLMITAVQDKSGTFISRIVMSDISERKRTEEQLKDLLSEKEVLLKEVHHRVKNNFQIILSLISLQSDNLTDKRTQWVLSDAGARIRTIALVHEMLYKTENLAQLDFAVYAADLLQNLWRTCSDNTKKVSLNLSLAPLHLPIGLAVNCGLILNELATNALKHAFPNDSVGDVTVVIEHYPTTGDVCLIMSDNGIGLPAEFDWRQSISLGLDIVQMLASQIRASVQTGPGPGTEFRINFNVNGSPS